MSPTAGLLLLSLLLPLQEEGSGSLGMRREGEFARQLTIQFGFDDLSESVLEKALEKATDPSDRSQLLLTRCEVRKLAAARTTDPKDRLKALGSAAEAYDTYLAESEPSQELANQAETDLAQVAYNYGDTLKQYLDSAHVPAEERAKLVAQAEKVFEGALRGVNALIDWWNHLPDQESKDSSRFTTYYPSEFYRALIYYHWSLLYAPGSLDRMENSRRALEYLEGFALIAGASSSAGFTAYKYMADTYAIRGENEDAEIFYNHILENALPDDPDVLDKLGPSEIERRQKIVQQAYLGYMDLLRSQGRSKDARRLAETFRAWVNDQGVILSPAGYRMLLRNASSLAEEGRFQEAIDIASMVERENSTSLLRLEANEVMARAIQLAPPDAEIDLGVLYSAAEGAFFEKKYAQAVEGFRSLIPRLQGAHDAGDYGAKTYYYLGWSWSNQDRPLEAAAAHKEGFQLFPDDEEFAAKNAQAWLALAERFVSLVSGDTVLMNFRNDALEAVQATSRDNTPAAAIWTAAKNDYSRAKTLEKQAKGAAPGSPEARKALAALDQAKQGYAKVPKGTRHYEEALVGMGLVEFRKIKWDPSAAERALKIFSDYLEKYIPDPGNTPVDAAGRQARRDASAKADYYRGQVRVLQAVAAGAGHPELWEKVLQSFDGYLQRHPQQTEYGAATLLARTDAFLQLGRIDEAVSEYESLVSRNLPKRFQEKAAFSLFQHFDALFQKEDGKAGEKASKNLAAATNYLHIANSLSNHPAWQNLQKEARYHLRLGEVATSADLLQRILKEYDEKDSLTAQWRFFVELDLLDALLAQDKTGAAAPIVERLLESHPKNLRVMIAAVKVLAGFPVLRDGGVVEVPGVGTPEAFQKAADLVKGLALLAEANAKEKEINKYSYAPYWEAKFDQAYILYRRSKTDGTYRGRHRSLIDQLKKLAPSLGGDVVGEDLPRLFQWLRQQN